MTQMASWQVAQVRPRVWRLTDVGNNRAFLVTGTEGALLVDTGEGLGDLRATVQEICDLPLTVVLTHHHHDHIGCSYQFPEVWLSQEDDGYWDQEEAFHIRVRDQLVHRHDLACDSCFPVATGARPKVRHLVEGQAFDLGGLTVIAVALPGHTRGSMGFLVREDRLLLAGDAVTPIMTLFYKDSTSIDEWADTLRKMQGLPCDAWVNAHYDKEYTLADLDSWLQVAAFAKEDRGFRWENDSLSELRGQLHVMSPLDMDPDSPDYRGLIEKPKPRVHKGRRRRHAAGE